MDNFSSLQSEESFFKKYVRSFRHDIHVIIFSALLMLTLLYADDLVLLLLGSENVFTDAVLKLIYNDVEAGRAAIDKLINSSLFINILSVSIQLIMLLIPALISRKLLHSKPKPLFPLKAELPSRPMAFVGLTFGTCYTVNICCSLIFGSFYPSIGSLDITDTAFSFASIVIIAPIFEELVFRGIFFRSIAKYDRRFAIILSALIFGLMHRSPASVINAVVFGIFAAVSCAETGSLLMGIMLHMTNNAIAFAASSMLNSESSMVILALPLSVFMIIMVLSAIALWIDCRVSKRRIITFSRPTAHETPRLYASNKLSALTLTPWTWLFLALLAYSIWLLY